MTLDLFAPSRSTRRLQITPRAYQVEDSAETTKLYRRGVRGILCRLATGLGKTICACMTIDEWLANGPEYRAMVISYEKQLVWQFAQEIEDVLRITPGIEMEKESVPRTRIPKIVVASRQTLLRKKLTTDEQKLELEEYGISDVGLTTSALAKRFLKELSEGVDPQLIREAIEEHNAHWECNHDVGGVSRLYKFPHELNWLAVWDEAHKHAHKLTSVGHIHDWFHQNPTSWDKGLTATPKRFDGVSIGDKMFPGVSVDYPLTSAIRDGYAVPYIQKYIVCDEVDFTQLKQVAGDYDESELERVLFAEGELAKLCEPMLDMVDNRRTLIFSPTIQTAKDVANYVNARREMTCPQCGMISWIPSMLISDGATCKCGHVYSETDITKHGHQAGIVYGDIPPKQRREVYRQHQSGAIQFLSVCGLCKEGYNDPDIGAVAVFRPVSKKASSLAEQMKGRASRVQRGLIEGVKDAEERLKLIKESDKPNALIIDLVGITGLADCASTVSIYAEGRDDEVVSRAEELQIEGTVEDVQEAMDEAERQIEEEREERARLRKEQEERDREEAERRAKAKAEVSYSTYGIGHGANADPNVATTKQMNYIRFLGMEIVDRILTRRQAGRIITQLKDEQMTVEDVAYSNGIESQHWEHAFASVKQSRFLARKGINAQKMTRAQASAAIDAIKNPGSQVESAAYTKFHTAIDDCATDDDLTRVAREIRHSRNVLADNEYVALITHGKEARNNLFR